MRLALPITTAGTCIQVAVGLTKQKKTDIKTAFIIINNCIFESRTCVLEKFASYKTVELVNKRY